MAITVGPNTGLMMDGNPGEEHYDELTHFLRGVDCMLQPVVIGTASAPPTSPDNGDCYVVGSSPSGAFSGKAGKIARYSVAVGFTGWEFYTPKKGWEFYDKTQETSIRFDGNAWQSVSLGKPNGIIYLPGDLQGAQDVNLATLGHGDKARINATDNLDVTLINPPVANQFKTAILDVTRTAGSNAVITIDQVTEWENGELPLLVDDGICTITITAETLLDDQNNPVTTYKGKSSTVAALGATTFNPSDTHTDIAISADNRTLTALKTGYSPKVSKAFFPKREGKWQYALELVSCPVVSGSGQHVISLGVCTSALGLSSALGSNASSYAYFQSDYNLSAGAATDKNKRHNNAYTAMAGTPEMSTGQVWHVLVDHDDNKIWWAEGGNAIEGDPEAGTGASFNLASGVDYHFAIQVNANSAISGDIILKLLDVSENAFKENFPSFNPETAELAA